MFFRKSVIEDLLNSFAFLSVHTFYDDVVFYFNQCAQLVTMDKADFEHVLAESFNLYGEKIPEGFMDNIHDALA